MMKSGEVDPKTHFGGPLSRHGQGIGTAPHAADGKPVDGFWNDVREDTMWNPDSDVSQVILPTAPGVSNEGRSSPLLALAPPFLGPGFRLGARWNRLVKTVKTRKKREKTEQKWARYGLKGVKEGS